ncbi:hypothetical protein L6470_12745 [Prevotella communis]|uniref:hypothetical protein n=1 Tax=Prevotella communis TaxID=2913614 RepID=UPI001EDBC1D1|nr:hypothetical protein [Prevotella communis]UKK59213.1 hypothetical protein L6470_12745 [Prevotella communis]
MKKYFWTLAVMAIFAIGFAASDEETSSSEPQKQESPAEKEASEKQEKIKRVAEMAYKLGYETRKKTWGEALSSRAAAEADYRFRYAKDPEDEGQSERWKVFLENYKKGFSDCADDMEKKFKQEEF